MSNNIYSRISPLIFTNFLLAVIAGSMLWNIAGSSVESMAQAQPEELTDLQRELLDGPHARKRRLDAARRDLDRYRNSRRLLDSPSHIASMDRTVSLKIKLMELVEAGRMSQEEADREFSDFIDQMARQERAYAERGIMDRDIEALLLERIRNEGRIDNHDEEILALMYEIEMNTRR
tara:strand:+ start:7112 stop:7642 length:531 start_codon:yes stop_codon:yes gene_type:complete